MITDTPLATSDVLTLAEAAAYLKVHPQTLLSYARSGRIPATRLGRQWRFRRDLILAWMATATGGPSPAAPAAPPIHALLDPRRMQMRMKTAPREATLQELVNLVDATGICEDAQALYRMVLARDGTGLATGAAVWHPGRAVPEMVRGPVIAYGRALDGSPTRMFFLVCAAREEDHGRLVDALTRMLKDAELCGKVFIQNAPEGVIKVIREREEATRG